MTWKTEGAEIVGACRPWQGRAAFARAPIVLSHPARPGSFLIAEHYRDTDVSGDEINKEEWDALLRTGEALLLPTPVPAMSGDVLWLLRPRLGAWAGRLVQALEQGEGLRYRVQAPTSVDVTALLVTEPRVGALRDRLATETFDAAWQAARDGRWEAALDDAERAHLLGRGASPERLAMLILSCEKNGQKARAEGYFAIARNSYGETFLAKLRELHARYRAELVGAFGERVRPWSRGPSRRVALEKSMEMLQRDAA